MVPSLPGRGSGSGSLDLPRGARNVGVVDEVGWRVGASTVEPFGGRSPRIASASAIAKSDCRERSSRVEETVAERTAEAQRVRHWRPEQ